MKKPIRIILLILTLLWLAFLFDTQLIVLRDDGMFTLHYNVPDEMKGKMYAGASWYSNSFMCRHLSFGSGRFEGTEYGDAFDNVEEKPGEWVSHIPTKVWHPFCTWELGRLTIGMDANEERTQFYDLAYAYLSEEKESDSEKPAKQEKFEDSQNESFLVCDISEYDFKYLSQDKGYSRFTKSYECKNPYLKGATYMSSIPFVSFFSENFGKISISFSGNIYTYLHRNLFDKKKGRDVSYHKKVSRLNGKIYNIDATLSNDIYWIIESCDTKSMTSVGKPGSKPEMIISTTLTPDQLIYLASENVWELPDFLQQ